NARLNARGRDFGEDGFDLWVTHVARGRRAGRRSRRFVNERCQTQRVNQHDGGHGGSPMISKAVRVALTVAPSWRSDCNRRTVAAAHQKRLCAWPAICEVPSQEVFCGGMVERDSGSAPLQGVSRKVWHR